MPRYGGDIILLYLSIVTDSEALSDNESSIINSKSVNANAKRLNTGIKDNTTASVSTSQSSNQQGSDGNGKKRNRSDSMTER